MRPVGMRLLESTESRNALLDRIGGANGIFSVHHYRRTKIRS
jgi:hypothetical protein